MREKVVNYATSDSEGENNNKSKSPAEQLVENYNIKVGFCENLVV